MLESVPAQTLIFVDSRFLPKDDSLHKTLFSNRRRLESELRRMFHGSLRDMLAVDAGLPDAPVQYCVILDGAGDAVDLSLGTGRMGIPMVARIGSVPESRKAAAAWLQNHDKLSFLADDLEELVPGGMWRPLGTDEQRRYMENLLHRAGSAPTTHL